MKSERWQRIEALYHSALERGPAVRAAFLDGACGEDAELRREIESLLAESPTGQGMLEQPLTASVAESRTVVLASGTLLGPYQIEGLIGQGGMGKVYKTRDTRLGRIVAIKTVSARFNQRFEREARAVAALNHPHICHLYDVGPDYLVMEYIEGTPLRGPLPTERALEYAEQILDALDAAHRRGIVHRDLKPGNILVAKQGIKLLDFGLAQMERGPEDSTVLPSVELMGTPAYMAPEQWEGKPADARSDIYSFGCVLYEMLTGRRVTSDREPLDGPLEDVLRACLKKDPDERWQSARELRHALRWAGQVETRTAAPSKVMFRGAGWIAAGVCAAALAALALIHFRETPPPVQPLRAAIEPPSVGAVHSFAVSPDGRYVVFAMENGPRQLWLREMNSLQARPLPFTEDAFYPFWSPDSRFIAFFTPGKLKKIEAGAGPVQTLCDAPDGRGGSWSRDNIIIFSPANSGISIQRVSAAGGVSTDVTKTKGNQRHPRFLPDGRHFLYLKRDANAQDNGIYVSSIDGSENRRVLPDISGIEFAPPARGHRTGYILFARDNTLMAAPFEPTNAQIEGDVFPVVQGVTLHNTNSYLPVAVSGNGVLLYEAGPINGEARQIGLFDRSGKSVGLVGAPGEVSNPAFSPNEKLVAYQRSVGSGGDLWVHDLERGTETRLTNDSSANVAPFWSPRGDRIVFASNRSGVFNLYEKSATGNGPEERLLSNGITDSPTQWSRDGRFIVYFELDPKNKRDLWTLAAGVTPPTPVSFLRSEFDELFGQLSPDSHWIAFTSDRSGRREVYVRPFPDGDGEWTISIAGGMAPRWRGDGKELFFIAADNKLMAAPVKTAVSGDKTVFEPGAPVALFNTHTPHYSFAERYFEYDVSADGRRFVMTTAGARNGDRATLTVVTNWLPGVKK